MKAWMLAAVAVVTFVFAGCTTEPEESFQEIRVDAFSHYWASQKAQGVVKPGNRIVRSGLDSNGTGYIDTLVLVSTGDDKTQQLPGHTLESVGHSSRIVYAAGSEPEDFNCYFDNEGRYLESSDTATPLFNFRSFQVGYLEGEQDAEYSSGRWFFYRDTPQLLTKEVPCGYLKGKGFYFGSMGYDYYAEDPYAAGGTLIIRYR